MTDNQDSTEDRGGMSTVAKWGWAIFVVVVIVVVFAWPDSDNDSTSDSDEVEFGAFDVCTEFVKERLKAPGTAQFPDYFDADDEVIVTRSGANYVVDSHVDSENSFGALLQTPFTCEVAHVDGTEYRLVDLTLDE